MNWSSLAQKAIPAPFTPSLTDEFDVSSFSDEELSIVPQNCDNIFRVRTNYF
jgi:hypothetical protein